MPTDPTIGRVYAGYRAIRKIAEGGMGAVYEAIHGEPGRRAAIKVLLPELLHSADAASRFFNEAKAVSLVSHPSLVIIFEHGTSPEGAAYIIMEYLDGDSLRQRLEKMYLGGSAIGIIGQLAAGLSATHEKRIIHRDLKPENIMLVADAEAPKGERAKILDFGIAKLLPSGASAADRQSVKTRTGTLIGTPTYMSPEQCRASASEPPDEKTDVYALGIIFYELLYGEPPFTSESAGELFALQIFAPPPELRERVPAVNPVVAAFVHRLLDKKAANRPTMPELLSELRALPDSGLQDGPLEMRPCALRAGGPAPDAADVVKRSTSEKLRQQLSSKTGNTAQTGRGEQVPSAAPRQGWLALAVSAAVVGVCLFAALYTIRARHSVHPAAPVIAIAGALPSAVPTVDAGNTPPRSVPTAIGSASVQGVEPPDGDSQASSPRAGVVSSDSKPIKRSTRRSTKKAPSPGTQNEKFRIDVWK